RDARGAVEIDVRYRRRRVRAGGQHRLRKTDVGVETPLPRFGGREGAGQAVGAVRAQKALAAVEGVELGAQRPARELTRLRLEKIGHLSPRADHGPWLLKFRGAQSVELLIE